MDNEPNPKSAEAATARFAGGFNCSQAVFATFAERLGLDEATALKIASGFGGGMGSMGHTCGAVTGGFMSLGLKHGTPAASPASRETVYARVCEFARRFQALHGSLACRDLIGYDLSDPEGLRQARQAGVFKSKCPEFVRDAALILEELL